MFIISVIITSILLICLLALSFFIGYKVGKNTKENKLNSKALHKDSVDYFNQFLNLMNYTGKSGN